MDSRIKLIRPCTWEEVFLTWYEGEGNDPKWRQVAKEQGYASWADWRINGYAKRFACAQTSWGFYEIMDPSVVVADWYGGPFKTWIEKRYGGAQTRTFAELAEHPDILDHAAVKAMANNFPEGSVIIALELKDGRFFVIEGMHRSCALALMAKRGLKPPAKLIFAIGHSELSELPASDKAI